MHICFIFATHIAHGFSRVNFISRTLVSQGKDLPYKSPPSIRFLRSVYITRVPFAMLRTVAHVLTSAVLILSITFLEVFGDLNATDSQPKCVINIIANDLNAASQIIDNVRKKLPKDLKYLCRKSHLSAKPLDCSDLYRDGYHSNGRYEIWPQNRILNSPLSVYCDMTSDGGGWMVIQRRGGFDSPQDYFYRDWNAYKTGFGDILKDFRIGNDNIYALTNQRAYQLKFDLRDWEENFRFATYDEFWIEGEFQGYTLHANGYRGTAGDSFKRQYGAKFTTKDRKNDIPKENCAILFKGGWWYSECHDSNLNGLYLKGIHESYADGVNWKDFKGYKYSLKDTVMKIRPTEFGQYINEQGPPQRK